MTFEIYEYGFIIGLGLGLLGGLWIAYYIFKPRLNAMEHKILRINRDLNNNLEMIKNNERRKYYNEN